jgi:cytochrome P450
VIVKDILVKNGIRQRERTEAINDMEQLLDYISLGGVSFLLGVAITWFFFKAFFGTSYDKDECDEEFKNGASLKFVLKLAASGLSQDAMWRITSRQVRHRLYAGFKTKFLFGDELWFVGHPAICEQAFGGKTQRMWTRLSKRETLKVLMQGKEVGGERLGMLYAGSGENWRNARGDLTPHFYGTDFSSMDSKMDEIVRKHLQDVSKRNHAAEELLQITFTMTTDLLCQLLYGCVLPPVELGILVDSLGEYIVPGSSSSMTYPGGLNAQQYHYKKANDMASKAPEGTLAWLILNKCPSMNPHLQKEQIAFFMEALTPAFASFWTICNILAAGGDMPQRAKDNAIFRQQCIKESLRMYPPVPALFPRKALADQIMDNPLYDKDALPKKRSLVSKLFGPTPITEQKTITIKKGTVIMVIPSLIHYDDRFWVMSEEFRPQRWDKQPDVLVSTPTSKTALAKINFRKRKSLFPGLAVSKDVVQGPASSRASMLQSKTRKEDAVRKTLRSKVLGFEHEMKQNNAAVDHLAECTHDNVGDLERWTYFPFGLGQHTCLGRRLAIRIVDSIVYNFLEHNVTFYNGITPSLISRKRWYDRCTPFAAAYNYPADPVHVQIKLPKVKNTRVSVMSKPIDFDLADLKATKTGSASGGVKQD